MTRTDWLCQCGMGLYSVPEEDIPGTCPLCGQDTRVTNYQEEDE